jgi:hypothetical protein
MPQGDRVTWFKVDDGLAFHSKTIAAGNAAMGLWVRAGSWSSQHLTDGNIPKHVVRQLGNIQQAKNLVTVGLWDATDEGYCFHEWDLRNPSRADVEADRAAGAERLRKHRERKRNQAGETDV